MQPGSRKRRSGRFLKKCLLIITGSYVLSLVGRKIYNFLEIDIYTLLRHQDIGTISIIMSVIFIAVGLMIGALSQNSTFLNSGRNTKTEIFIISLCLIIGYSMPDLPFKNSNSYGILVFILNLMLQALSSAGYVYFHEHRLR